jgi:hypothetical protein
VNSKADLVMGWLGIDIGGANLKISDGRDWAHWQAFALWKSPQDLPAALRRLLSRRESAEALAVTMTGELADCFAAKAEGVRAILHAVLAAAPDRVVRVYRTDGRLVPPPVALAEPQRVAASNWHVLAAYAGRFAPHGSALLIDLGSTTCDLVPLQDGRPAPTGFNDTDRLLAGELVYTGIERSPVCAVVHQLPYRGQWCPVAQELFATTRDVYLLLGDLPEDPDNRETADGRPATRSDACRRLARLVCADDTQFGAEDAWHVARRVAAAQAACIGRALDQVLSRLPAPPATIVLSGHGDFLLRRVLAESGWSGQILSLAQQLNPAVSRAATAYALAVLAREAPTADGTSGP